MATLQAYNDGLDQLNDWTTATFQWLLLTAGTFDADHATVADVLAGGAEATVTGYSRQAASTKVRDVDDTLDRITYRADDPSWAGLAAGEDVTGVVLVRVVTDDSDSIPVCWFEVSPAVATDSADPLVCTLTDGVVAYMDLGA
jgi:hypothetical protein